MSENLEKYRAPIEAIYEETKDELWTMPFATLVLLLGGIFLITIIVNLVFFSFPHFAVALLVYLFVAGAPLFVLYRFRQKVYETAREKVSALEAAQPGILSAFEEWHGKPAPRES